MTKRPGGGFAPFEDVAAMAAARFAESTLTIADAKVAGITWHDATETVAFRTGMEPLPSIRIPYFMLDGKTPARARPGWPEFFRLRALRPPSPKPNDWRKYRQPEGSGMCAYFPPLLHPDLVSWTALAAPAKTKKDTVPLFITEGEFKALAGCKAGFATIGLGGVDSFRSRDLGVEFLPELDAISWLRRRVYIVFDSDVVEKPEVARALWTLAGLLRDRGALPMILILPDVGGDGARKTGLDDYLAANSPEMLEELVARIAVPLTSAAKLWYLN